MMRHLKFTRLIILIIPVLFYSCSNELITINKRHYRSGYNVTTGNKSNAHLPNERATGSSKPPVIVADSEIKLDSPAPKSIDAEGITAAHPNYDTLKIRIPAADNNVKVFNNPVKSTVKKAANELLKSTVPKANTAAFSSDNETAGIIKNLVWFVIVVLLLAYTVALLAGGLGLGLAVHLLLIAAIVILMIKLLTPV